MIKLLIAVILLIVGALVAGAYFDFNPAIPIFVVLGFGIYMVGRIGGPQLPEGPTPPLAIPTVSTCTEKTSCPPTPS